MFVFFPSDDWNFGSLQSNKTMQAAYPEDVRFWDELEASPDLYLLDGYVEAAVENF